MPRTQRPVAVVGAGYTELTRTPGPSEAELAIAACRAAIADAGLTPADIDGINVQVHHYPPPDTRAIMRRLGLAAGAWRRDGGLGVAALGTVAEAIDAGAARAVVVCKIMNTQAPVHTPPIDPHTGAVHGRAAFEVPYGLGYTMQRVALLKRRWMHRHGITDEQVARLCVVQREHALRNPVAIFRKPLTVDDYLVSRWIADPLRLLDCDYPVNGAFAYVAAGGDVAAQLPRPVAYLSGWATLEQDVLSQHLWPDPGPGPGPVARDLYRDTGLRPADLDVWLLYDGFSFLALQWMEDLGLVERGESGAYVGDGSRIRIGGEHPLNTHGGQLSEGRMHGTGHILEALQQIRGTAGARQVRIANRVVVTSAYPLHGGAAILRRELAA